ncbi:hypothetical protein HPB49_023261 [Dermacentor silvarum]|nr:hypothetical protein HPB49_023261 [Dermacentor silvarum]
MSNGDGVNRGGGKTGAPRFVYTREERELLRNLVVRYRAVIENRKTDNTSKRAKDSAWEKLTEEYNSQPGIRRVTVVQLRKLWDNEKSKWKKKDSEEKRDFYATDNPVEPPLPAQEGAVLAGPSTVLLSANDPFETSFSPELAGPATPAQERDTTHAVPTAAESDASEAQAGIDKRLRPARGRIAAIERVLAPEGAARLKALQKDDEHAAELHSLEMRLRRQQLLQQRRRHRMDEERKQELHKIEIQLRQQQLEQQKWRNDVERQMLLLELEAKKQQLAQTKPVE